MDDDEEERTMSSSGINWRKWVCTCACCEKCWSFIRGYCCCCLDYVRRDQRKPSIRKDDITYILQHAEGESDTFSDVGGGGNGVGGEKSERHDSFTSGSLSVGSSSYSGGGGIYGGAGTSAGASGGCSSGSAGGPLGGSSPNKDFKDLVYEKIEARRASSQSQNQTQNQSVRKESGASAPLIDFKSIDFWSAFSLTSSRASTSEPQPVQPKLLLSPNRRDTISSQGSADQIRPDLYEPIGNASGAGEEICREEEGDPPSCTGALGALHFFLSYDIHSKILTIRLIEAKDLPKPITQDSSKTDQAHSNPYVKICLLPNQKDSRQTALRKKTQNPRFDENISFEIPFRELQRRTLQMVVKDFDKYSRHRVIGQVLLPLHDVNVLKGVYFWKPMEAVQALSQEDLGELLFSLCYLPAAGRLNVDILRAKQLTPTDLTGAAAPYVKVTLVINERHVKTKKTSYKKYTLDPVFNESLSFDVNSVQLPDCSIIITVLDFNGGVMKDHFIGRLVLGKEASGPHEVNHWKNMMQSQRTAVTQWHTLRTRAHCDELSVTKFVSY